MRKILVCPKCKDQLVSEEKVLKCHQGHSFDIAKQGYVNLVLGNAKGSGDDKDMCISRHEFHNGDFYKCLSEKLAKICCEKKFSSILDAGCGEGYYLRKIRKMYVEENNSNFSLCGIDLAKDAVLLGAKLEKLIPTEYKIEYAVAGIFDMPVADNTVDCVLSVFAPVPDLEAHRVLKDNGYLIVVSPGEKHLDGLKSALYDDVYYNELSEKQYAGFSLINTETIYDEITVEGENIINLFHMTPYYWKTSEKDADKLNNLKKLTTKIEFVINIYKKI